MKTLSNILAQDAEALENLAGKTFLITGGNGMLGRAFREQLERHAPAAKVHCLSKIELDVRNPEAFEPYVNARPDYVLHCAALVDADYCEEHADEGEESIVTGTSNVIEFARCCGSKLLYPQSFLIYDGAEPIIDESSEPQPLSVYGRLKLQAERLVLDSLPNSLSVRMGGFFGGGAVDSNFVGRIAVHLAKQIRQGLTQIEIGNRVWQPTYTNDLAANSLLLLAADRSGIYCMASHGSASFSTLTQEILQQLEASDRMGVQCVDAAVLAAKEKAKRPLSAIMRNHRLQAENFDRQRTWQESLAEYLNQPYFRNLFNE
jgi:dTDP-4-dehydrorhamnose reductase